VITASASIPPMDQAIYAIAKMGTKEILIVRTVAKVKFHVISS
jgi:hypothetical protein